MKYESVLAAVAFLMVAGLSVLAHGASITGFANASTYLHAGPGQDFPIVAHVPPGADIRIVGCSQGFIWCDVAWNGNRGWIAGRFLDSLMNEEHVNVVERGASINMPKVVFEQRTYWRTHYRDYPFYGSPRYWPMLPGQTPAEVRTERYNGVDE
jgi:uncharacterized protein YraI